MSLGEGLLCVVVDTRTWKYDICYYGSEREEGEGGAGIY
jgi:hypothetical protein